MSITSTKCVKRYTPTELTTVFPYDFRIDAATNLEVWITTWVGHNRVHTLTKLALTTDYTVSGVGVAGGGNVTIVSEQPAFEALTIRRVMPMEQGVDLTAGGPWLPEVIEAQLDKLTMMIQELRRDVDSCVKVPLDQDASTVPAVADL